MCAIMFRVGTIGALIVVAGATAAIAQSAVPDRSPDYGTLFVGLGGFQTAADSTGYDFGEAMSSGGIGGMSFVLGWELPRKNDLVYSVEVDVDLAGDGEMARDGVACADGATASYLCDFSDVGRFGLTAGPDFGTFRPYAGIGFGAVSGRFATGPDTTARQSLSGLSLRAGVDMHFGDGPAFLRAEVVHDRFNTPSSSIWADPVNQADADYSATSIRLLGLLAY